MRFQPIDATHWLNRSAGFLETEGIVILLAGVSASNPEIAAVVDTLVFFAVPNSPEYKTVAEQYIAYVGLGALAIYNYNAPDDDRSKEDIFTVNLVVFNIVLASEIFGSSQYSSNHSDYKDQSASLNFQVSREGEPRIMWEYRF